MKKKRNKKYLFEGMSQAKRAKELIEKINPKKIIPIHTEHPRLFEEMFPGKIILPTYTQSIEL